MSTIVHFGTVTSAILITLMQSAIERAGVKDYRRPFSGDIWVSFEPNATQTDFAYHL